MIDRSSNTESNPSREVSERATLLDHDIRNAIADILGGLDLLASVELQETSRSLLERSRQAAMQLSRLSQEALSLAIGETELMDGSDAVLHLDAFLETLTARFGGAQTQFQVVLSDGLPDVLQVPPHTLERILTNLLGNAFKYGAGNPVKLMVHIADDVLVFAVVDRGDGFSDTAKARLFDFSGRGINNDQPGSGHGLHIANSLARELGGHLSLETPSSGGTIIALHLPRTAWQGDNTDARPALLDLSGKTILIVEDSQTLQMVLQRMVEAMGAQTDIAADGLEALGRLARQSYDLALVDIEMPRLSGLELIQEMRAQGAPTADLPILAVTAYVLNASRQELYDAGADGILVKPVLSAVALSEAIEAALETRANATASPVPEIDGIDTIHIDRLLAFCDAQQAQDLLFRLIADLENVALSLERAPPAKDYAELRSAAHILVALSGAVGAVGLQSIAERLNAAAHAKDCHNGKVLCSNALQGTHRLINELREETAMRFGGEK